MQASKDFFEEFGLEVSNGEVEVGNTYPVFGMITKFLDETPGQVKVEINYGIVAHLQLTDPKGIETLRERAFETGIFVSRVVAKDPVVEVECQTIIYGRKQGFHA